MPQAGTIPASLTLDVTGSPSDGDFLYEAIRRALDREIRPTLRPGAGVRFGAFAPWPLLALPAGTRTAVNVFVQVVGDPSSVPVQGTSTVTIDNVTVPDDPAVQLFYSDDPEVVTSDGLAFQGEVTTSRPTRLYYYHTLVGMPRDLDVVLTAATPARVQLVSSQAGPDLDVMAVGHEVSSDFLRYFEHDAGEVVEIAPGKPFVARHVLMLQGEVAAGSVEMRVLDGGPIVASVVASPAGASPGAYLAGPHLPRDGYNRHGIFDLVGYGDLTTTYTTGGTDATVRYGDRTRTPRNLVPGDPGHDYGDYGVIQRIAVRLVNPTDVPQQVYLYEKPAGGPVRAVYLVDGTLKQLGCVRLPWPYWITTYALPAHSTGVSTTVTMTEGGSFYPVVFGVTPTPPNSFTPPVGSPQGCSPLPVAPVAPPPVEPEATEAPAPMPTL